MMPRKTGSYASVSKPENKELSGLTHLLIHPDRQVFAMRILLTGILHCVTNDIAITVLWRFSI